MTSKEKKAYILKHWSTSSGERITQMVDKYWASLAKAKKSGKPDIVATAKEIFS